MSHGFKVKLALDGGVFAGRYEDPRSWMRLTREAGFDCLEISTDLMDPLLGGDDVSCRELAQRAAAAAAETEIELCGLWAGRGAGRLPGLCHSDAIVRQRSIEWAAGAIDIAVALDAPVLGGRLGRIPQEVLAQDEHTRLQALRAFGETVRELAAMGRDKGLQALLVECGTQAGEVPWTVRQAEELLTEVNRKGRSCPVYLRAEVRTDAPALACLAQEEPSLLEALGAFAPMVRVVGPGASEGDLGALAEGVGRTCSALDRAHAHATENWISEVLPPVELHWLVATAGEPGLADEDAMLAQLRARREAMQGALAAG